MVLKLISTILIPQGYTLCSFSLLLAALVALVVFIWIISLHGIFQSPRLEHDELSKSHLLYLHYKGPYEKINYLFSQMKSETTAVFKISKHFVVFFDNPNTTLAAECRAAVGVIVNIGEASKVRQFLDNNGSYKQQRVPAIRCQTCTFPYISFYSCLLVQEKIYEKYQQEICQVGGLDRPYSMEIYNLVPFFGGQSMQVATNFEGGLGLA